MSLRRAIRRASGLGRAPRRMTPVEQVLRAPQRPLVQHAHHQHLTVATVRLHVSAPVHVVSSTRTIRTSSAGGETSAAGSAHRVAVRPADRGTNPSAFPRAVLRTPYVAGAGARETGAAAGPMTARSVQELVHRAATGSVPRPGHRPTSPPTRVELVHRQPTAPTSGPSADRSPRDRTATDYPRPGTPQGTGYFPQAPGAVALTDADVPRVVDHVVRELDRRLVATRERRGWTS